LVEERVREVEMDADLMKRSVNEGFSGGEKKRNEILQMSVLDPKLALLDETDSGLDIDALKIVAEGVNRFRAPDKAIVIVTHYQRILNYITPDYVHVLLDGRIVRSGGRELALELEAKGYEWITEAVEGLAPARGEPVRLSGGVQDAEAGLVGVDLRSSERHGRGHRRGATSRRWSRPRGATRSPWTRAPGRGRGRRSGRCGRR
ncbi:MAG TPA: hypothetical protein VFT91_00645, partial [Dehalococcoidia bacterium]|nr:hypothetical protein [Dehalococcoidia bacterium]